MIAKRITTFLIAFSLVVAMAQGQIAITPSPPSTGSDYTFTLGGLPKLCQNLNFTDPAFYGVFWYFGNGEYAPAMDPAKNYCWENYSLTTTPASAVSALCSTPCPNPCTPPCSPPCTTKCTLSTPYNYPGPLNLNYQPFVISLPRKGSDPPPPSYDLLIAPSNITCSTPSASPTARIHNMPAGRQIYLAHSHGYLNSHRTGNEKSVFIISYKDSTGCIDSSEAWIHLFYGCKRPVGAAVTSLVQSAHFGIPNPRIPVYLPVASPVSFSTAASSSPFNNHDIFYLPASYVTQVKNAIGNNEEQRLFEVVDFANPGLLRTGDWSYAMAVLTTTGNCPCPPDSIKALLQGLEGYNSVGCLLNGQHIVDADNIFLKSGEPDDPNRLPISKLCTTDNTIHLTLHFCNAPSATGNATGAKVKFNILDPSNFEWCRIGEVHYPGVNPKVRSCGLICFGAPTKNTALYNCSDYSVEINGALDRGDCASVEVVLKLKQGANLGGMNLLDYLKQTEILEAMVWLYPNQLPFTVINGVLSPDVVVGADCGTPCEGFCFTIAPPVLGVLVLVLASLLVWGVRRFRIKAGRGKNTA